MKKKRTKKVEKQKQEIKPEVTEEVKEEATQIAQPRNPFAAWNDLVFIRRPQVKAQPTEVEKQALTSSEEPKATDEKKDQPSTNEKKQGWSWI
ncbi:hypothetical protein BKP45_15855 [Anaerobacillus alkalidiazotrophicus]|uniref:Uncharacterized protein n=1 Tax=Anaerobacillus alkalidiazotrophicus TaxID=472963 RepID=A0A1S2M4B9_9BACI|nr:hypothetical protein [Anaerobacillus alkalidiazotrophicus]OIJ18757.1 hypothetical protein BKP45_15855 [Anaerobacillus alkalidiazotrophicus]